MSYHAGHNVADWSVTALPCDVATPWQRLNNWNVPHVLTICWSSFELATLTKKQLEVWQAQDFQRGFGAAKRIACGSSGGLQAL